MCDTILAMPSATADQALLFGKNSDRQRNEAQTVELFERAEHPADTMLRCTYIAIPQVLRTHAVLLCRPFWIWGAEMGANEHGVVIGNEGLRARIPAPEEPALTGMDLVRLALERATSAAQAVEVLTKLLERHGQGGNCGHLIPSFYHNGFMVADHSAAFVLETVGREWFVERVQTVRSLSNVYSIGRDVELVSGGLQKLVRDWGWNDDTQPHYATMVASSDSEHIGYPRTRMATSAALMRAREGRLCAADMMTILRDHGSNDEGCPAWNADVMSHRRTLCMHAGANDRFAQTVGSMVSELRPRGAVHWLTGTAAPCISIFKPMLMDVPLPFHGPLPSDRFDGRALWWKHERLHRAALQCDFDDFLSSVRSERDALEMSFAERMASVEESSSHERMQAVNECWVEAAAVEERWEARVTPSGVRHASPHLSEWDRLSEIAGVDWSEWQSGEPPPNR